MTVQQWPALDAAPGPRLRAAGGPRPGVEVAASRLPRAERDGPPLRRQGSQNIFALRVHAGQDEPPLRWAAGAPTPSRPSNKRPGTCSPRSTPTASCRPRWPTTTQAADRVRWGAAGPNGRWNHDAASTFGLLPRCAGPPRPSRLDAICCDGSAALAPTTGGSRAAGTRWTRRHCLS